MTELVVYYGIFAISTALVSMLYLLNPVLVDIKDSLIAPAWAYRVIYFFIATITAPIMIVPCLVHASGEKFKEGLKWGLLNKKN